MHRQRSRSNPLYEVTFEIIFRHHIPVSPNSGLIHSSPQECMYMHGIALVYTIYVYIVICIRLTELLKQHFGVLELYEWFATKTCFWHETGPGNHLGLIFGVPGSKWRCASFWFRRKILVVGKSGHDSFCIIIRPAVNVVTVTA